jgi:hypothetical protein
LGLAVMSSSPDRPHAALTESELEDRIATCCARFQTLAGPRNDAAKRVLASLRRDIAALIDERNSRADMQTLPF